MIRWAVFRTATGRDYSEVFFFDKSFAVGNGTFVCLLFLHTRYISMYSALQDFYISMNNWILNSLIFREAEERDMQVMSHSHYWTLCTAQHDMSDYKKVRVLWERQGSLQTLSARDRLCGLNPCVLRNAILLQQYNNDFSASNNLMLIASGVHACLSQATIIYITSSSLVCLSFWSCLICWLWLSMHLIWCSMDEYGVELRNFYRESITRFRIPQGLYIILYFGFGAQSSSVRSINIIDC